MKFLSLIGCIVLLAGCGPTPNGFRKTEKVEFAWGTYNYCTNTVVIENCEYIVNPVNGGVTMCHKGNCSNRIHAYNK